MNIQDLMWYTLMRCHTSVYIAWPLMTVNSIMENHGNTIFLDYEYEIKFANGSCSIIQP